MMQSQPIIRRVPASSVPYGEDISRNGKTVWAAYDDAGQLVAVGASAREVRRKYRRAWFLATGGHTGGGVTS